MFHMQGSYLWTSARPSIPLCRTFSQTNWHSSPCPRPSASGSPAPWQTGRTGQTHIQNSHHQHWRPSGLCSLPTALLLLHQWLHFKGPLCQAPEVCGRHYNIGLIKDGDESAYRQLAVWGSLNNLELNTLKSLEIIVDFRRNLFIISVFITLIICCLYFLYWKLLTPRQIPCVCKHTWQ